MREYVSQYYKKIRVKLSKLVEHNRFIFNWGNVHALYKLSNTYCLANILFRGDSTYYMLFKRLSCLRNI